MATAGARIGFLGAGKMASALAKGWLTAGLTAADRLCASDPLPAARETFAKETGAFVTASNRDIVARCDGGVRMGLPRDVANLLATQTVLGSAKLLLETGLPPGALKDMVASPGGTTIAGLHALERGGLRSTLMDAVEAATRRAVELGKA